MKRSPTLCLGIAATAALLLATHPAGAADATGSTATMAADRKPAAAPAAFAPARLAFLLPEQLGDWKRTALDAPNKPGPERVRNVTLRATYEKGATTAELSVDDSGGPSPLVASWNGPPVDRATATGREAIYKVGRRVCREVSDTASRDASVTCTLGNGVAVVAMANGSDVAALRALVQSMDLDRAEALRRGR